MRGIERDRQEEAAVMALTAVLAALFGVLYTLVPLMADDTWYLQDSTGPYGSWERFQTTVATCFDHWQWDTGRLSNMMSAPFLSLLPKWVYATLTAFAIWIIYQLGHLLSKTGAMSISNAVWIAAVTLLFPWFDYMLTVVYSVNYVWELALGLGLFWLLRQAEEGRPFSRWQLPLLFLIGVAAGWWHEGFSVPALCGLTAYYLIERRRPSRAEWALLLGLLAGALVIFCMPAFWAMKEARESNLVKSVLWETLFNVVAFDCIYYLYIFLLALALCVRRWRQRILADRQGAAFLGLVLAFGTVATLIYMKYYNGPRTGAFPQMVCLIGVLYLFRYLHPSSVARIWQYGAMALACILSAVNLIAAIPAQIQLTKEYEEVFGQWERIGAEEGQTVFYDQTPVRIGIDLLKPTYQTLNNPYGLKGLNLVPSVLKDFKPGREGAQDCGDGLWLYRNRLVLEGSVPDGERIEVMLQTPDGEELSRTRTYSFTTPEGVVCTYIQPHAQTLNENLRILSAEICR